MWNVIFVIISNMSMSFSPCFICT